MSFFAGYLPPYLTRFVPLVGLLFAPSSASSQDPPPESFFPHHLGDTWVYYVFDGGSNDTLVVRITKDSAGADGRYYVRTSQRGEYSYLLFDDYRLDTLGHVCTTRNIFRPYGVLYYDFTVPVGTAWITDSIDINLFHVAKLLERQPALIWGQESMVKHFSYYTTGDFSDTTFWLSEGGDYVASGFGLIYRGGGDLGYQLYLIAASIGGTMYGDTALLKQVVSVEEDAPRPLPEKILLAQNYPNPFNSSTWIEFSLPHTEHVAILIYDVLGREVATLANSSFNTGTHKLQWQADKAASGVYFCTLKTPHAVRTQKMIIQR